MTFEEAVARIGSLEKRGWRLGLDRMQAFADACDLTSYLGPPGGPNYVHVAGTNGKGSVTANLQAMLAAHGKRTGAFFSPYVVDVRERVQFQDRICPVPDALIPEADFARLTAKFWNTAEEFENTEFGGPTEFEFKTALGLAYWKEKQAEWVALEVGLGGRLDATNIVDPACSVIVSIGWDHMAILGNTLAKIASEKAGVLKPGRPAVVGRVTDEVRAAIEERAQETGSEVWWMDDQIRLYEARETFDVETPSGRVSGAISGIQGHIQKENSALAVAALMAGGLDWNEDAMRRGAAMAFAPGRFQLMRHRGINVYLDGAHNVSAAEVLAESLELAGVRDAVLVTGMLTGHEPAPFYERIAKFVKRTVVVPIAFNRARNSRELAEEIEPSLGGVEFAESLEEGWGRAVEHTEGRTPILVTGSFYLVGEVARLIASSIEPN